ncbi:DUF1513 domain-containing protein [Thalassococcus sp. S3]|uniref:DUF1513 domain-containing protein n=1 Tax=Thalassococcus sp. S3 TaxID=2017482 RepID=UPI0010246AE2|nr:DUF1513 domain-containing protein [Thalassococcus sp. S3]QBF30470.1 twin-arginine translocation pathway signal [Thalassococcus sp. S3]
MATRRGFIAGLLAAGGVPALSWADAGTPAFLAAAMEANGAYALFGLKEDGTLAFRLPLPDRGHAAAAHPTRPEVAFFARRPGQYALVLDCVTGAVLRELEAPTGQHFYGHGAFFQDGELLATTENIVETGQGVVGLWSRSEGYRRIGSFSSGGVGPHELIRLSEDRLAIANGGIRTHPGSGRAKLNLETMRPNLTLMNASGHILGQVEPDRALHRNSLRHIAALPDGAVACAFQWQGDVYETPALLAIVRDGVLQFADHDALLWTEMQGYAGSIAIGRSGPILTGPRGGVLARFDQAQRPIATERRPDVCGIAARAGQVLVTDGLGHVFRAGHGELEHLEAHPVAWDNHVVALT